MICSGGASEYAHLVRTEKEELPQSLPIHWPIGKRGTLMTDPPGIVRRPWDPEAWTSSDDRVRGGKSQSYLDCPSASLAAFHGNLDITALGGAGFASQRTVDPRSWDLNAYDGLLIRIGQSDGKKYTLNLKDDILPKRPDGREQSTVSWEYDFTSQGQEELRIPFGHFKPTYRGKDKPDATPLNLADVKRISIMMRRSVAPSALARLYT